MVTCSRIYRGTVRHRRFAPRAHQFCYDVFMLFIALDEIEARMDAAPLWSARRWAPARYKRSDFFGDPSLSLDEAVRQHVAQSTGHRPSGKIFLLANFRYLGYLINPIAVFYCYDSNGDLEAMVVQVTNTPWGEQHSYVLATDPSLAIQRIQFDKALHVSPFHPMAMQYLWRSNLPGQRLALHLANQTQDAVVFDATLKLRGEPMTSAGLMRCVLRYPWMTFKVCLSIYWQAMRLIVKRVPLHRHPLHAQATTMTTIERDQH